MTTTKTYELRASAVRAAKKAGLAADQFDVVQVWEDGGKSHWTYQAKAAPVVVTEPTPVVITAPLPAPVDNIPKLVVEDYTDRPKATKAAESAPTPVAKVTAPAVKTGKSTVEKPTKAVWAIADEMRKANPGATRKEIVNECIRRGIAFYTARTQYQRWSKSKN